MRRDAARALPDLKRTPKKNFPRFARTDRRFAALRTSLRRSDVLCAPPMFLAASGSGSMPAGTQPCSQARDGPGNEADRFTRLAACCLVALALPTVHVAP